MDQYVPSTAACEANLDEPVNSEQWAVSDLHNLSCTRGELAAAGRNGGDTGCTGEACTPVYYGSRENRAKERRGADGKARAGCMYCRLEIRLDWARCDICHTKRQARSTPCKDFDSSGMARRWPDESPNNVMIFSFFQVCAHTNHKYLVLNGLMLSLSPYSTHAYSYCTNYT